MNTASHQESSLELLTMKVPSDYLVNPSDTENIIKVSFRKSDGTIIADSAMIMRHHSNLVCDDKFLKWMYSELEARMQQSVTNAVNIHLS